MGSFKPKFLLSFLILSLMWLLSCSPSTSSEEASSSKQNSKELAEGFSLLESSCFNCHSPNAGKDSRIAPPMAAVMAHYVSEETSYDEFRSRFVAYIQDPSEENTRMPGAVRKFGVMPKMSFDSTSLERIAYYLYHNEIEAPDWFQEHYKEEQKRHRRKGNPLVSDDDYMRYGKRLAMQTKSTFGSQLKQAINERGTTAAVDFCNHRAIELTDSMSVFLDAGIKRVSDQPRNPQNVANSKELEYILSTKEALDRGETPKPLLTAKEEGRIAYYSILTNSMCLQCHGTPKEEIMAETLTALTAKYPEDQAKGYSENELRGIWVFQMMPN